MGHATDQAMVAGNLMRSNGFNPRPSPCGTYGGKKWHRDRFFPQCHSINDRLCGLVVRVSGYRYRGPGFDSRHYQIF